MGDIKQPLPRFSPIENVIMKSVWGGNNTTRTIYDALPEAIRNRLTFSTISTYLMRMVQKGYLKRSPTIGREFEYTASVTEESLEEQKYDHLEPTDKGLGVWLKLFAGRSVFSEEDRKTLRKLAEKVERKIQGNDRKRNDDE